MTTKGRIRTHSSADKARRTPKRAHQDKLENLGVSKIKKRRESSSFFQIKTRGSDLIVSLRPRKTDTSVTGRTLDLEFSEHLRLSMPPEGSKFLESYKMKARWKDLLERAEQVMGSLADAREWLEAPEYIFEDKAPIQVAQTDEGYEEVCQLLGRIEHGVFS